MSLSTCLKAVAGVAFAVVVAMPAVAQQNTVPTRQIQIEKQGEGAVPEGAAAQPQDQGQAADKAAPQGQVVKVAPEGGDKAAPGGDGKVVVAPGGDPKGAQGGPGGDPKAVQGGPGGEKVVKVVPGGEPVIVKKPVIVVKPKPRHRYVEEYYDAPPRRYYGGYGYERPYGYGGGYGGGYGVGYGGGYGGGYRSGY